MNLKAFPACLFLFLGGLTCPGEEKQAAPEKETVEKQARDDSFLVWKCTEKHVHVTGFSPVRRDGVYDKKGKPLDVIHSGLAYLYVGVKPIELDKAAQQTVEDTLSGMDQWKKKSLPIPSNPAAPVGLYQQRECYMIRYKGKWLSLDVHEKGVELTDAELIIDQQGAKIFVVKTDGDPILSDDVKVQEGFLPISIKDYAKDAAPVK